MFVWCFMMGTSPHLGQRHSKNVTQDSLLRCPRPLILRMITPWGSKLHITTFFLHLCTCFLQHQIAPMSLQFVLPFIGKDGFLQLSPREARLFQSWICMVAITMALSHNFPHLNLPPPPLFSFTIYVYMWLRLYNIGWHAMYLGFIITFLDLLSTPSIVLWFAFLICIWPFCVLFLSSNLSKVYVLSKKLSGWFPQRIPLLQISMIETYIYNCIIYLSLCSSTRYEQSP